MGWKKYYTVYDVKTEEMIAAGDAKSCASQLNMHPQTFYSTVSKVRSGKNKRYEIEAIWDLPSNDE